MSDISPRISVIIPAYNEGEIIPKVLDALCRMNYYEIILVDDGSDDDTLEVAQHYGVKTIRHPYNIGNGAAIKSGIRAATGDIIVLMDGDGQHSPSDIPRLVSYVGDYDMVVGARTKESETQFYRSAANRIFNAYASYIVDHPVHDLTSGFRAIKAPLLKKFAYLLPNGFSYPSTLTIALFRSGFRVCYEPIVSQARVGKSKINPFIDGLRFLLTITNLATMFVPMKIFLPVSMLFLIVGIVYGGYYLISQRDFRESAMTLVLVGVMVFLIGLIAEHIATLRLVNTTDD